MACHSEGAGDRYDRAVTVNQWVAQVKREIFETLISGGYPGVGRFDEQVLLAGRSKGAPQIGATILAPNLAILEYSYSDQISTVIFRVEVEPPERIVFMPVPPWVVENVWQGEVAGSHHFESHARELMSQYTSRLDPGTNDEEFQERQPIGKN